MRGKIVIVLVALIVLGGVVIGGSGWSLAANQEPFPTPRGQLGGPERLDPTEIGLTPAPTLQSPTPPPTGTALATATATVTMPASPIASPIASPLASPPSIDY